MTIERKALEFAIKAHEGQVRKSEPDKPMIFHPIDVGIILKEYGYDENVVAAGFLHDVVEDTKFTLDDIRYEFGDDIASLVYGASEPDKSLSWEERKKHTIETIKTLDDRHKAVICADKISNLEDLNIIIGKKQKYDFTPFKRGFFDQQWYYTSVYESLTNNYSDRSEMYERLNDVLNRVFYNGNVDINLRNNVLNDNLDLYKKVQILEFKKQELKKLKRLFVEIDSYVIKNNDIQKKEKKNVLNNLEDYLNNSGKLVEVIDKLEESIEPVNNIFDEARDEYIKLLKKNLQKEDL